MQLGQSDQRIEVSLIGFERRLQSCAFTFRIPAFTIRLGEVEPQGHAFRVCRRRSLQMSLRCIEVVAGERFKPEQVMRDRMIWFWVRVAILVETMIYLRVDQTIESSWSNISLTACTILALAP